VATARALVTAPSCCSLTSRWPRSTSSSSTAAASCGPPSARPRSRSTRR